MTAPLPPKHAAFVLLYAAKPHATEAAIGAGYSPKTAASQGARLLKKANIAEAIQREVAKRARAIQVTPDSVLFGLARVAFADPRRLFDDDGRLKAIRDLDDDTAGAIAGVKVVTRKTASGEIEMVTDIRLSDRVAAGSQLGRFLHMDRFTREPVAAPKPVKDIDLDCLSQEELLALERMCLQVAEASRDKQAAPALIESADEDDEDATEEAEA